MRVLSHPVRARIDPPAAFAALFADSAHAVWLDSGSHATSGMSVMGDGSRWLTSSVHEGTVTIASPHDSSTAAGSVFDVLRADLAAHRVAAVSGFPLGWVGWLGYELRAITMGVESVGRSRYPDAALAFIDRAVAFDHASGEVSLLALGESWSGELLAWRDEVESALTNAQSQGIRHTTEVDVRSSSLEATWAYDEVEYLDMIRACQAAITAGDAYQLCLTTEARLAMTPDPFQTYLALRASSPTHHGALLRAGEVSVLSASPEQFLAVSADGRVTTKPIKGTRRRGHTPGEDAALRDELVSSEKERAENLMIVDLMRNDIGRIARVGSVGVSDLLAVESYAQVHQLVSVVHGTLADDVDSIEAVTSCFPAGSMTGAPKSSATRILHDLERRARGVYSGALGYFGLDGSVDLAMVIRSIVLDEQGATIGTGGGITALSVPEEELDEVYLKAAALLRVLGAVDPRDTAAGRR